MNNYYQQNQQPKPDYQKKNQIILTSIFNDAIKLVSIELEQKLIKEEEYRERFDVWYKRLLRLFVEKEINFLNDYFNTRKEVVSENENNKNERNNQPNNQ